MTDQPDKPQAAGTPETANSSQPAPPASEPEAQVGETVIAKPADNSSAETTAAPAAPPLTDIKPAASQPAAAGDNQPDSAAPKEMIKSSPFTVPITDEPLDKPSEPASTSALPSLADILKSIPGQDGRPPNTAPLPPQPNLSVTPGGIICPNCGHRNRPGILLCENCGTNLTTGRQPTLGTRDLKREQEASVQDGNKLLDTAQTKAIDSAGGSAFTESMVLRFEIDGAATPMLVYPKPEIILGRRDPNTGAMPDVDLTAYAGYRMGVSRRHASIRFQDRQLHVSDLGSSNGTFLNGTRLNAHRPYQLRDGDEVRLGQMVLRLYFQTGRK